MKLNSDWEKQYERGMTALWQGCMMFATLFNIHIEEMFTGIRKANIGVKIGKKTGQPWICRWCSLQTIERTWIDCSTLLKNMGKS